MAISRIFEFSLNNPLRTVSQIMKLTSDGSMSYTVLNPNYDNKNIDKDFYFNNIRDYEKKIGYCSPYQKSDTILQQWLSDVSTVGSFSARLLNADGTIYTFKTISVVAVGGTYSGMYLYYIKVPLWDVPEGKYFVQIRYTGSPVFHENLEPIHIKERHEKTLLIDYSHSANHNTMICKSIGTWYKPQIRVRGEILEINPDGKHHIYRDNSFNTRLVSATPSRMYSILFGADGIPEYLGDKLNRIISNDYLTINGIRLVRTQGTKLEPKKLEGTPFNGYINTFEDYTNVQSVIKYGHSYIIVGDMPQTDNFFVEKMTITSLTNIRKGFTGKKNFLDYLNTTWNESASIYGYWAEGVGNKLIFVPNDDYDTAAISFLMSSDDVLLYGLSVTVNSPSTIAITVNAGTGTKYHATSYGTNKTALTGSFTLTTTTANYYKTDIVFYFNDALTITKDASWSVTAGFFTQLKGNLPISLTNFSLPTAAINNVSPSLVNTVTVLAELNLTGNSLPSNNINDIVIRLYEKVLMLTTSCVVTLSGMTPTAIPSRESTMITLMSAIRTRITTLSTD
jgi:hypothetical protein